MIRSQSPEDFRVARLSRALQSGFGDDKLRSGSAEGLRDVSPTRPGSIGRHSQERLELRSRRAEKPPSDSDVDAVIQAAALVKKSGSASMRLSPSRTRQTSGLNESGTLDQLLDTSILGTSQLVGCQGDFCTFDLSGFEIQDDSALAAAQRKGEISDFRRNLMMADSAVDFEDSMPSNMVSSGVFAKSASMHTLPFRTIIQTRQEMPLVYRLLRKMRKGDARKFKYVTEDSYNDLYTGGKLPSHYYKDVRCCDTCFKVYNIVSEARSRAIAAIEKSRDATKTRREGFGDSQNGKSTAHTNRKFTGVDLEDSFIDGSESHLDETSADRNEALSTALQAIEGLTKLDVAEIRTLSKPPAAVEVVMEAVMALLVGKTLTFAETRKLLSSGEGFLLMLRDFSLETLTDDRLRLVEPYVDNPVFRPENVMPVSLCASKFCAWVLGVVQAARWQRGQGHKRSNLLEPSLSTMSPVRRHGKGKDNTLAQPQEMSFVEKLKQKRARKEIEAKITGLDNRGDNSQGDSTHRGKRNFSNKGMSSSFAQSHKKVAPSMNYMSRSLTEASTENLNQSAVTQSPITTTMKSKAMLHREKVALMASQKRAAERLASHNKSEGNTGASGNAKTFRCCDGITKMPYIVLGNLSLDIIKCNFVVVHDFFDTCDATAIALKPIALRHDGCQIFCFNYPGQSNTVWPRPSHVEKQRGAKEKLINNEWIADRLHELLQHAEESGDFLLTNPFHLVGIGNGAPIAAAFALRWGQDPLYKSSLRSVVSINGFLYPDPQLSAILHSASQIFESTPHSRPDIPVSFWSRYVFSDDYLSRVNPNLALNIYTAVANPITNDGRLKITRGCLQHKDLRNALSPDYIGPRPHSADSDMDSDSPSYKALTAPLVILQSTEDMLVNAANVDTFLSGRKAKHLWSHQQNVVSTFHATSMSDANAHWVGKLSQGPEDYAKFSVLGRSGLKMLLQSLSDPRGAFVMWTRSGHAIFQENKSAVLDVFDVLASPTESYVGLTCFEDMRPVPDEVPRAAEVRMPKIDTSSNEMVLFEVSLPAASSTRDDAHEVEDQYEGVLESPVNISDDTEHDSLKQESLPDVRVAEEEHAMMIADAPTSIEASKPDVEPIDEVEESKDDVLDTGPLVPVESRDVYKEADVSPPEVSRDIPEEVSNIPVFTASPALTAAKPIPPSAERPSLPPNVVPTQSNLDHHAASNGVSVTLNRKQPSSADVIATPSELAAEVDKRVEQMREAADREAAAQEAKKREREKRIEEEQAARMLQYEAEDAELLEKLNAELEQRRKERERADRMRRLELQQIEQVLVESGAVDPERDASGNLPVREIADMKYDMPTELPPAFHEGKDVVSSLDRMLKDEEEARKRGIMSMEQFEAMKAKMVVAQIDRDQKIRHMEDSEQQAFMSDCAVTIQRVGRGHNGRKRASRLARDREIQRTVLKGTVCFQAVVRGVQGRKRAAMVKRTYLANLLQGASVITMQRVYRGYTARKRFKQIKRVACAINVQRCFRGYIGRMAADREKKRLYALHQKHVSAMKIQSIWRMKVAKEEFRSMRIHMLAAIEIQRCYRGYLGRKVMKRRREWEAAPAGPERIKLGLKMIEESKVVFERQQEEIDALHRAQERAEARVSHIHSELKESEKELVILERELQEIDQIERDLQNLTHEKDVLVKGIRDAAGMPRSAMPGHENTVMGREPDAFDSAEDSSDVRRKKAEAYALELTIQIKRAEREKKRQELETEFASVFQEVEKKRKALERLEASLSDMEATRERKDREFRRLQKNLMQLLLEQKQELDDLREKGIELETATATSAAAATATAMKAKEHEKQSAAMFSQTEELMKFQFMSMSLSYFSSLNMLKQLRDMNAETTSAAVASAADTAASAAAAATAANLPSMKKLHLGADDFVALNIQKKKAELEVCCICRLMM